MRQCRHTCWLKPWGNGQEIGLEVTDRPQRLLRDFDDLNSITSGFVVLIGSRDKQAALRKIFLQHERIRPRTGGEVHLLAPTLRESARKIILADTDIPSQAHRLRLASSHLCHETISYKQTDPLLMGGLSESYDFLLHKTLFPFADVVCVFVHDIGGFDALLLRLKSWTMRGAPSTSPVQPQLLLVVDKVKKEQYLDALDSFLKTQKSLGLNNSFRGVTFVGVPRLSRTRRWQVLGPELSKALEHSRQSRRRSNFLFSTSNLVSFLSQRGPAMTDPTSGLFDFLTSSRIRHDIPMDLSRHILNFLNKFDSPGLVQKVAIPLIASSLLLDHYLPDMHLFDPHRVFRELYETACSRAAYEFKPGYKNVPPPAEIVRLISGSMFTQFAQFQALGTSRDWHREQLTYNSSSLAVITSRETCFSCIRRRPKYNFPCGHFICEHCIRTFCHTDESDPWLFLPEVCLICSVPTPGLSIRLIPDTCRTRVLSIDGGGVRGAAPIGFLKAIEDGVGIPGHRVQRLFDVKIGTSSGALAVTSLDVLGWSIEDCMAHLKKFAEAAFPRSSPFILRFFRDTPIFPAVARLLAFLHACLTDSKYPSDGLELLLMDTYGSARQITGISNATEMGTHVGITLTRVSDGSVFLATNYNEVGSRSQEIEYHHLKADDGQEQPTWDKVIRAATAAPYYFPPEKMNSHGKFQDGGITHNNPACIAIREAIALSHDETEPSIVVSLGTGSGTNTDGEPSGMLSHWFPLRLWRALWKPTESKSAWKHLRSHYNQASSINFYRFDVDFAEDEPLLDEVDKMDGIWETAHQNIRGSPDLRTLCRQFRAEFFLFELDERCPPQFWRGAYQCTGHVSCRLRAKTPEYEGFMQQLCSNGAYIQLGAQVLEFTPGDVQKNIRFSVRFSVPCLDSPFSVKLVEEGQGLDISGSPFTAKWLIRRQGLDMSFGTTDHRKRRAFECLDEREPKRRKRWVY